MHALFLLIIEDALQQAAVPPRRDSTVRTLNLILYSLAPLNAALLPSPEDLTGRANPAASCGECARWCGSNGLKQ